jgi:hypothetical protein
MRGSRRSDRIQQRLLKFPFIQVLRITNRKDSNIERFVCDDLGDQVGWNCEAIQDQGLNILEDVSFPEIIEDTPQGSAIEAVVINVEL